jgi:hypothetical protein
MKLCDELYMTYYMKNRSPKIRNLDTVHAQSRLERPKGRLRIFEKHTKTEVNLIQNKNSVFILKIYICIRTVWTTKLHHLHAKI